MNVSKGELIPMLAFEGHRWDIFSERGASPFSMDRALGDIKERCLASTIASARIKASAWVQARAVAAGWVC